MHEVEYYYIMIIVMRFPASEIKAATDNFNIRHLVGEGGFGRVYRAMLRHTPSAIKLLNKVFINKVDI